MVDTEKVQALDKARCLIRNEQRFAMLVTRITNELMSAMSDADKLEAIRLACIAALTEPQDV